MNAFKVETPKIEAPAFDASSLAAVFEAIVAAPLLPSGARVEVPGVPVLPQDMARRLAAGFRRLADQLEAMAGVPSGSLETVRVLQEHGTMKEALGSLGSLQDDWDGEGAPKPSGEALQRAQAVMDWAESKGLLVVDLDADVLGGVALYLRASSGADRQVWIGCMNKGGDTAVMSTSTKVEDHCMFDPEAEGAERVLAYLRETGEARG